jgi:hypothetical protein
MKHQKGFTSVELFIVLLVALGGIGWIWNIVKIVGSDFANITGMLVMRCVGVFIAPLGAVLGFL